MLLVKTKIGPSKINGIGLFADQLIPKEAAVWRFTPEFDQKIDVKKPEGLPPPAREQFLKYSYLNAKIKKYVLCSDDARFFNHSDNPNVASIDSLEDEEGIDIALREIGTGEELTCDYKQFDADFAYKNIPTP